MPARFELDELGRKRCGKCHEYKPLSEYQKNKAARFGVQSACKACSSVARRNQYQSKQEYYIAYRERVRGTAREYARRYYENNGDVVRHKNGEFRRARPEKGREYKHRRRAKESTSGGFFTAREWMDLKKSYNNTCLRCGKIEGDVKLTIDHVLPISMGGSNSIHNIQPLCFSCNSSKQDRFIDYRGDRNGWYLS